MSKISGKNTLPEILVRKFLFSKGFRFRVNQKNLPGKPDIVLEKYKTIIQVHGCFWHGHKNCRASKLPQTNNNFWKIKINSNIERDKKNKTKLKKLGYKVITVWQCQLKNEKIKLKTLEKLTHKIL